MLSNIRFAAQKLLSSSRQCSHTDQIRDVERGSEGCEQCIALGDTWVHQELTTQAFQQARMFGAGFRFARYATGLRRVGEHLVVPLSDGTEVSGRAAIVATGAWASLSSRP